MSYAEELEARREEARKSAFKKKEVKNPALRITEGESRWAQATVHLREDAAFKVYLELENAEMIKILSTAYRPPPAGVFQSNSYGENMAFNAGVKHALTVLKQERDRIWMLFLKLQEEERKEKQNG